MADRERISTKKRKIVYTKKWRAESGYNLVIS